MSRKTLGIILAAGRSSRLFPATLVNTKQVLPIYDKPLIYYPLTTLMLAGIRDFVIISNPSEKSVFEKLFQDAPKNLGINITFAVQETPRGIADAFNVAHAALYTTINDFDRYALILGDNIFYGAALSGLLEYAVNDEDAAIFVTPVNDPHRFGIVEINENNVPTSIDEKPENPTSNLAVTGLYFYPKDVFTKAYNLKPSSRGELEITDLNRLYLDEERLAVGKMLRGMVWFDTGTPDSMMEASSFIQTLQNKQGLLIGSPQEIAYNSGWIDKETLLDFADKCKNNYGKYLRELVNE